ncbi:hypothetical protein OC846_000278 [Tilletia horrida]|uniref:JmjC domain-containing protein n=1 Tax=Tilletia horrida TaxID=155126 RepID=A0AAN6GY54_9BASI|nr:hypothetical protein OC846_000278 [Tilletia horrida]
MVEHWPIFDRLPTSTPEDPNVLHPAFDILRVRYGQHVVPVAVPGEEGGLDGAGCGRTEMPLADAIQLMHARKARGLDQDPTSPGIYVKDWHLFRLERLRRHELSSRASDASAAGSVYEPPPLFRDDWMNNLPRPDSDDFAFCYAGSCGSATGLHRDVYTSYSWSTNVVGRKRWRLFPPHCAAKLRRFPNVRTSELASNCDELDAQYKSGLLGPVANGKLGWPEWAEARAQACEIFQEPGETIFVPSNWYHEVLNITDCISINHNWCNSYNLESMFRSMVEEVEDVSSSLEDVRMMLETGGDKTWQVEWVKIVQDVARQDAGWAWEGFFNMVELNLTVPPAELGRSDLK